MDVYETLVEFYIEERSEVLEKNTCNSATF
jgi:hypothetical protein